MANVPRLERYQQVEISLPPDVHAGIALILFSPAEGRIPKGAWSRFFTILAKQALERVHAESVHSREDDIRIVRELPAPPRLGESGE